MIVMPLPVVIVFHQQLQKSNSSRMGDCQLDDLLDMLDDDDDFEEATVDDPGSVDESQEDVEEGGDEEEEMAQKLREMEEQVLFN